MHSVKLEQELQKLSDALSEFDDALTYLQMKFVSSPNILGISHQRLLHVSESLQKELLATENTCLLATLRSNQKQQNREVRSMRIVNLQTFIAIFKFA